MRLGRPELTCCPGPVYRDRLGAAFLTGRRRAGFAAFFGAAFFTGRRAAAFFFFGAAFFFVTVVVRLGVAGCRGTARRAGMRAGGAGAAGGAAAGVDVQIGSAGSGLTGGGMGIGSHIPGPPIPS